MDECTLRNLALDYAIKTPDLHGAEDVLAVASRYYDFLIGKSEAPERPKLVA